ncbi:uncharacterized protein [Argopecten irradians]|uniref:uncharacterized protein n=1 Tax=Argopecten irradians TaxID=31199 RepID=UPI00371FB054
MQLPLSCVFAINSFLFVLEIGTVSGVLCYQCTTVNNKDCDDPFHNKAYSPTECSTICVKIMFKGTVERGCYATQTPFPVTGPGGSGCVSQYIPMKGTRTVCRCSTSRCNAGIGNGSLLYLPLLLSGLILAFFLVL